MKTERRWESEKTRLYNLGYAETDKPCPECGCFVWQLDKFVTDDFEPEGEDIVEINQECYCCGWSSVTYDA